MMATSFIRITTRTAEGMTEEEDHPMAGMMMETAEEVEAMIQGTTEGVSQGSREVLVGLAAEMMVRAAEAARMADRKVPRDRISWREQLREKMLRQ